MHLLGIICVYLTFTAFRPIYNDYKVWYDGVTKLLALMFAVFILGVQGFFFWYFDFQLRFGAIYFGCILLSGDFLEIYYGLLKNIVHKLRKN